MPEGSATLQGRVYQTVKQMILDGRLRPGQKLAERDLTEQLNVSRTPLREALNRLAQEGLIISKPQRGHFVLAVDAKTVEDLYELREVLEAHAIELALQRIKPEHLKDLDRVEVGLRAYDKDDVQGEEELRIGQRVHEIIAAAAQDSFLADTLLRLYDRLQMFIWIDAIYADEAVKTRTEHRAIIDAIRKRDKKRLTSLASAHSRRSKNNVLRVLRARRSGML